MEKCLDKTFYFYWPHVISEILNLRFHQLVDFFRIVNKTSSDFFFNTMLFYIQTFMVFILTLMGICFQKCVANIEENRFTFISTISKNIEPNVFREFTLSIKRILIVECSAACRSAEQCVGLDICDGRICRLWNSTNYQSNLSNTSNELCRWYIKVYRLYL